MNLKEQNQYDLLNDEKLKAQYEINMNKLNATTMPKPRAKVSLINWKSLDIHINYLRKTLNITHNSQKYKQRDVVHKSQKVCLIEMTYARKNFFLEFSNGNNILTFCISIHSSFLVFGALIVLTLNHFFILKQTCQACCWTVNFTT